MANIKKELKRNLKYLLPLLFLAACTGNQKTDTRPADPFPQPQTVELNTDEGEHEIYFKVAWLKSNTLKFETFGSWHFFSLKMNPIFFSLRNTDENFNLVIKEDNKVNGRPENKRTLKSFIYQSSMKGV